MHNKKGASPLPLRLTEVRPSTRMYRNRTWEHTPNGVYPQHPFPDIHLIGRFQLRANSGKYHFKTKIAKSVRFQKNEGISDRNHAVAGAGAPRAASTETRCAGTEVQGAGCGAKERRGAKVHGVRRVSVQVRGRRRVSVQVQVRGQKDVKGEGGETNRRGAQKSVGTGAGAGADRTGPSGQRLRTRRPRRRARPTV